MKKLFTLLMLMVCSIGAAWAEEFIVGRTLEYSSTPTDYTIVSNDNAIVTLVDGNGSSGTGKGVFYKTTTETKINAKCYRDKNSAGNLTAFNEECYAGFKLVIAEGYKVKLSNLAAKVAVGNNFTYKVILADDNKVIYTSADKAISSYNKTTAKNLDATITPADEIWLEGTVYVRLHYWNTGNSGSKYLVPLSLTLTGDIQKKAEVVGETATIKSVAINDTEISADALLTLVNEKTLTVDDKYFETPTVSFVKHVVTNYADGSTSERDEIEKVEATKTEDGFSASISIGSDVYTINMGLNKAVSLTADVNSIELVSEKILTATQTVNISGYNLLDKVVVSIPDVEGLSVTPAELPLIDGSVNGSITLNYTSVNDVPATTVNLTVTSGETTIKIPVTYSSTAGVTDIVSVGEATEWNFKVAGTADILSPQSSELVAMANVDGFADDFNYSALKGQGQYFYRQSNKCFQGRTIVFNTTVPGIVEVSFSNTGGNPARSLKINETSANETGATSASADAAKGVVKVTTGDVIITGYEVSSGEGKDVRIYSIKFTPDQTISISNAKFATCVANSNLDFTSSDVTAYAVTGVTATTVELTKVEKVKAGQAVVVGAEAAGNYDIPVATEDFEGTESLMKSSTEKVKVTEENSHYIVANGDNGVGFYPVMVETEIPAGKGYLTVETANAAKFLSFGLDATGISEVKAAATESNGEIYNLNGQRVAAPSKGLYIMNGKKVIFK